jgi:hypothetical protein
MSATLYYRPLKKSRPHLGCAAPSRFEELVQRRMGSSPWEFGCDEVPWLQGMLDAGTGIDDTIEELIRLIDKHGPIEVTKEY